MINDFIFLLSTMLVTFVAHYYYTYFTRVNPLPGPFPFPFIGNLPQIYWWFNGNGSMFYDYCYEKYGDVHEIYNGMVRTIVLCRSECLEEFMSKNTHVMRFHNSKGLEELGIAGKGITFNNNFKSWIFNRNVFDQATLSPEFTNEALGWTNKLFNELENYWNKLFLKGEIIKENKNRLNLPEWFNHYTNDMIIRMLTGEKSYSMVAYFDTLSDEKSLYPPTIVEDSVRLFQSLRKVLMGYSIFILIPPFLRNFVPFLKNITDDVLQNIGFIRQRLDAIIKKRRRGIENTPLDKPLSHDMLTTLIIKNTFRDVNYIGNDEASRFMTDSEIRVNLFDGILNGICKISNMLPLIVYYIVHNPDVKRKMLEEIDSIFQGNKKRPITKDDYYSLSYCEAIVKEVARVFPIIHSFTRYINKPNEIAGYQWPADTLFIINVKAIHNNGDYWEEPNKFNPDRWMVENFEPKKNSFIMFGGGLRLCPGRKLVMIELVCLMALLFRKYEINLVDMSTPIKTKTSYDGIEISELLVEIKLRN